MKNVIKISQMVCVALIITLGSSATFASNNGRDKAIEKAKVAVENATEGDWKTLSKSAKVCIRKNKNMEEALIWLNKSLEITRNQENLELLGDYYSKTNDSKKAIVSYVESIKAGKKYNFHFNTSELEQKIASTMK